MHIDAGDAVCAAGLERVFMSDLIHREPDSEIIHSAYTERVREAFKVFAEAISMGENEKACKDRFLRSLQITRRARDLAIDAIHGIDMVEPTAEFVDPLKTRYTEQPAEPLSEEYDALVKAAVADTRGVAAKPVQPGRFRR